MASRIAKAASAVALVGGLASMTTAQQPRVIEIAPGDGFRRLDDHPDLLQAQIDVKKAHIKAAEVALDGAKSRLDRLKAAGPAASAQELGDAQSAFNQAAAALDVRKAELKELEVRLKIAKQRPAQPGAGGAFLIVPEGGKPGPLVVPPGPGAPVVVDPRRLEIEVAILDARLEGKKAEAERAKASITLLETELKRVEELVKKGVAPTTDLDRVKGQLDVAKADLKVAEAGVVESTAQLKLAKLKLEEANKKQLPKIVQPPGALVPQVNRPIARVGNIVEDPTVMLGILQLKADIAAIRVKQMESLFDQEGLDADTKKLIKAELDAAKAELDAAKAALSAAEKQTK